MSWKSGWSLSSRCGCRLSARAPRPLSIPHAGPLLPCRCWPAASTVFAGLPVSLLTALSALTALAGLSALAALVACLDLAGLAALRLDKALDVAGAVGATTGAPAEPLSDAVLRRAGRADPEDVTMGFLREARVYREMDCYYLNTAHELRHVLRCTTFALSATRHEPPGEQHGNNGTARAAERSGKLRCQQHAGEERPSVLSRGTSHCIIPHDAVQARERSCVNRRHSWAESCAVPRAGPSPPTVARQRGHQADKARLERVLTLFVITSRHPLTLQ